MSARIIGQHTQCNLGEDRPIPRRDFLQGMLIGAASALTGPLLAAPAAPTAAAQTASGAQDMAGYYPSALTGLRGDHPGSFEPAHALLDGAIAQPGTDLGETYDLVVVGGGISGLAAAHFFRTRAPGQPRVLILENHDDFGGHAKRNEFSVSGGLQIINGGTLEIDSPRPYSPAAAGLIRKIGIDVKALARKIEHPTFYHDLKLGRAVFFDRETFGADQLTAGWGDVPVQQVVATTPLSARARADIVRIETGSEDYLPGLSAAEKKLQLSKMSYSAFLRDLVKADPSVVTFYQARTHGWFGVGADAVPALDCWAFEYPGFQGMKLPPGTISRMGYTPKGYADTGGSYKLHFPDGNATIARLLVRSLIPEAVPGSTAEDVVSARVDYARLDRPQSPVRVRLNSIVTRVANVGDPTRTRAVEITYLRNGSAFKVRAKSCVLACWNMMIPYLCPELPPAQKEALHSLVKLPLVYSSVALRNWKAFQKLGISMVYAPGSYHSYLQLNEKVDIGAYHSPSSPDQPTVIRMLRTPCKPGLNQIEQNKAGRAELLATSFATFEHNIRDQLARTLGSGGFDPVNDIEAITVNRWPHGYAPEYNPLYDPEVPPEQAPNVIGRAPFGRIFVANSDSGRAAYTSSAIDQADRAVHELLSS
jgi:spermidine dehydrogenase